MPFSLPRRRLLTAACLPLATAAQPLRAAQPAFPGRPVTMVVPYPPGGAADISARMFNNELGRELGQPVVVENVGGAAGAIGVQRLLRAPADGHAVLFGSPGETIMGPLANPAVGYRAEDLLPVALAGSAPVAVMVRPDFPVASVDDLIALAKSRPGKLSYGTAGVGTLGHVAGETIKLRTGTFMVHIAYRGGAAVLNDLIGGQIDVAIATAPAIVSMLAAGRIRALAVSSRARVAALPQVPSFAESRALKDLELLNWGMVMVGAATPPALVERLNGAINIALMQPAVREARHRAGGELAATLSPAQTLALYRAEIALYRAVASRIKPE
jgi:tripartite-type tricarboxylate transporter receptor subunit TctC